MTNQKWASAELNLSTYLLEEAIIISSNPSHLQAPLPSKVCDRSRKQKTPTWRWVHREEGDPSHDHVRNSSPSGGFFNLSAVFFLDFLRRLQRCARSPNQKNRPKKKKKQSRISMKMIVFFIFWGGWIHAVHLNATLWG